MKHSFYSCHSGNGPIIAVANHHGHALRPEVAEFMALDATARLYEEDPHTGAWARAVPSYLIAQHSRFEVDLNRPRESAVYLTPGDAWGLEVWKAQLPTAIIEQSLHHYDGYYVALEQLCREKEAKHGGFVILDLHSYNHRRQGPGCPEADSIGNPEVNIGTGTMDHGRWGQLIDRFMTELRDFDCLGRQLDVRENIKFVGRQFPKWVHAKFPQTGCAIAIEFKKFFMDEWSGELDQALHTAIKQALVSTLPGLKVELARVIDRATN